MKEILFSDCTLKLTSGRDGHALLFREKVSIAQAIAALGADSIELPAVTNLREDTIINKTISAALPDTLLILPVGADEEKIAQAYESVKDANRSCLQVALPVSTVQMEYSWRLKNAGMLQKIASLTSAAKALCARVEFKALDATRAEEAFLIDACRTAFQNGADTITLCDDAGFTLPDEWTSLIKKVKSAVNASVFVQMNDELGFGAAASLAAYAAGADGIKVCLDGKGALSLERAARALYTRGEELGFETKIDRTAVHTDVKTLLKSLTRSTYAESKDEDNILLDAQSSAVQIREAAFSLGYDLSEEDLGKVKDALTRICQKKDSVGRREFEAIVASSAMQVPSTYHLVSYTATSGNMTLAVAQVTLRREDEKISGVASGDGPIDAAFKALEGCVGYHYELDNFEIQSVTEGKEALGSALVRLRHEGKLYSGNGLSTDIVGASIRAYINALNKIVYEE